MIMESATYSIIKNETLKDEDYTYIDDYENFIEKVRRYDKGIFQEGKEEGRNEGRLEGEKIKAVETARKMLADGMDIPLIAKYSGLSAEQIEALAKTKT
jgi:predicted transposase/invertase (TIGR01784 family)